MRFVYKNGYSISNPADDDERLLWVRDNAFPGIGLDVLTIGTNRFASVDYREGTRIIVTIEIVGPQISSESEIDE